MPNKSWDGKSKKEDEGKEKGYHEDIENNFAWKKEKTWVWTEF